MLPKNQNNTRGSVLIWAVIITAALAVLVGAVLTIAFANLNGSIDDISEKQAYYTALSAATTVAQSIKDGSSAGNAILAKLTSPGVILTLDNIGFSDTRFGGSVSVTAELIDESTISISATALVSDSSKTISLRLSRAFRNDYPINKDFPGLSVAKDTVFVTGTMTIDYTTSSDLYVSSGNAITFANTANYNGTIYAESGAVINISSSAKFTGAIYAQNGVSFKFSSLSSGFNGKIYFKSGAVLKVNNKNYTVKYKNNTVTVSPNSMPSRFKSMLTVYETSASGNGWEDILYE